MMPVLLRIILIILSIALFICAQQRILVVNIIDEDKVSAIESLTAVSNDVWRAQHLELSTISIHIFVNKEAHEAAVAQNVHLFTGGTNPSPTISYYTRKRYIDRSIDKPTMTIDHVTPILESMRRISTIVKIENADDEDSCQVVSIAFSTKAAVFPTDSFINLYDAFVNKDLSKNEIILLGKTSKLTSISDWHDLQVIGYVLSNKFTLNWIATLDEVFNEYADRKYFSMLEPRPAMLEATAQWKHEIRIAFFRRKVICAEHHATTELLPQDLCHNTNAAIRINCRSERGKNGHCSLIGLPQSWRSKLNLDASSGSYASILRILENGWESTLVKKIEYGTDRFFRAESSDQPKRFCWDTGSPDNEDKVSSKIFEKIKGKLTSKPYITPDYAVSNTSFMLYTAFSGDWREMDYDFYPNIGKMYYAKRHNYEFNQVISTQFMPYVDNIMKSQEDYGRRVSIKAIMLVDGIYHTDAHWLFWMDADAALNSDWVHMPLNVYTDGVPDNKVWISTNYKALLTGVFLVRNNIQGRKLLRDWLSIIMSGEISCHGYDQAAIEVLMMQRLNGTFDYDRPFDLSCKHANFGGTGCNANGDYSCDYKFEKALSQIGFKTAGRGFWGGYSSFSRGCANDYVNDFHVSFETETRPRLHCFYCGANSLIEAKVWDGPLGGSNDLVRDGAVNAWFTNHKMEWLFFETWSKPNACKKLTFIPKCIPYALPLNLGASNKQFSKWSRLIAMVDGIALDIQTNQFCELSEEWKSKQITTTYMRDYKAAIAAVKKYNTKEWYDLYYKTGANGRDSFCDMTRQDENCIHGVQWDSRENRNFLLAKDYCKRCTAVKNNQFDATGKRLALQCMIRDTS